MTIRVAYLVSQYPAPSHVFIEREILALRRLGVEVWSFSVRDTPDELLLSQVMRDEAALTAVLQSRRGVLLACLRLAVQRPGALARAVARALRTGPLGLKSRLWQVFYLAEGIHLLAHLRRRRVHQVHGHFANNGADIGRATLALARDLYPDQPWVWSFSMHGPTEFENVDRHDLANKVAAADAVACITDFTRSQLMRLSPPSQWAKLSVVPMSVDVDRFAPCHRERQPGEPLRVLFVGRLVAEKGPSVLLEAVQRAVSQGIALEVRIAGGGPLADDLAREVATRQLTSIVSLLGAVGQDQVLALYGWADVFCLPSFQEGLPVVLMEAMATGLPVVTTPIAGIPELVRDGLDGLLVPPGRADLLAAALARLAGHPQQRADLGRRAREMVVARHSIQDAGRAQLAFLSAVAEGATNRHRDG